MYYKLVNTALFAGQRIQNIFYYRLGVGVEIGGFSFAGAAELATAFRGYVVAQWQHCVPPSFVFESIDVYPLDDLFQLVYTQPYHLATGLVGDRAVSAGTGWLPVANCAIMSYSLENVTVLANGINPPKRGYQAISPLPEDMVDEKGYVVDAAFQDPSNDYVLLADAFAANINAVLPAVASWFPIRMKSKRDLLGHVTGWESYSDIQACQLKKKTSYRKSRRPE